MSSVRKIAKSAARARCDKWRQYSTELKLPFMWHDSLPWRVESTCQHRFPTNVWCEVTCDHLTEQYNFPQRLTRNLQHELTRSSTNTTSAWRSTPSPHLIRIDTQHLNRFPNRWTMHQLWRRAELATGVTGFEPVRLLCAGLHERYGEYMQIWTEASRCSYKRNIILMYVNTNYFITQGNYLGYIFRLLISHLQAYFVTE